MTNDNASRIPSIYSHACADALLALRIAAVSPSWPTRRLQAIADLHLMGEAAAAAETLSR